MPGTYNMPMSKLDDQGQYQGAAEFFSSFEMKNMKEKQINMLQGESTSVQHPLSY